MRILAEKNKLAATAFVDDGEFRSFLSIQVDGDLGSDEIELLLVGIDKDDPVTGINGSGNQALVDDYGAPIKITSSTSNPLGIYRPCRFVVKKPVTANDVGIMLLRGVK